MYISNNIKSKTRYSLYNPEYYMSAQPNRFSSLVTEKKQLDIKPKPQLDIKPKPQLDIKSQNQFGSKPPIEPKSNRFNFTESELQKKEPRFVDQGTREDFGNRERPNFRDRVQFERDRRAADEAAAAERAKIELERSLTDAASFPELVPQQKPIETQAPNFLEKVKWIEEDKPIPWDDGLTILGSDDKEPQRKQRRAKTPYEIMSKQVELYETWKTNYIAQYGEYYYEKHYRFPNYDYEYFDKLDDKYEAELEELERLEEEKERDQYVEYNTHYANKNQYDE
jgi:hypothetical protein